MKKSLEDKLLSPRPGSKAAAAKEFGIDLTILLRQLGLTPEERLRQLEQEMISVAVFDREVANSKKLKLHG